jgi:AcrR family transcriptional regulator
MGRHREFDPEVVLGEVMNLFWERGYEGTSMADIVSVTGVAAPGLYAAFGNKQALFLNAVTLYEGRRLQLMQESLLKPTARAVVTYLLENNIRLLAEDSSPAGCLGINGALAVSVGSEPVRKALVQRRLASERALCTRLELAKKHGDFPDELIPEDYARYIMSLIQGMAVQAKSGATLVQLKRVADMALRVWPLCPEDDTSDAQVH